MRLAQCPHSLPLMNIYTLALLVTCCFIAQHKIMNTNNRVSSSNYSFMNLCRKAIHALNWVSVFFPFVLGFSFKTHFDLVALIAFGLNYLRAENLSENMILKEIKINFKLNFPFHSIRNFSINIKYWCRKKRFESVGSAGRRKLNKNW